VSHDAQSPSERAGAVLRAAEAAAAAASGAPAAQPPSAATDDHQAQLLAATGELEGHVERAHARLDALERALGRLGEPDD
jgi:hypothetical protein